MPCDSSPAWRARSDWPPSATTSSSRCGCSPTTSWSSCPTSRPPCDWPLAGQVVEYLELDIPDDEDLDQVLPAGDMSIFADLGLDEMELGALSGDLDLYPDEMLSSIASRLGFGAAFERAIE